MAAFTKLKQKLCYRVPNDRSDLPAPREKQPDSNARKAPASSTTSQAIISPGPDIIKRRRRAKAKKANLYKYSPLTPPDSIRILHLLPSADSKAPFRGRISYDKLSDKPVFEALSYAWGALEFTEELLIDDAVIPITPNLATALRHLRYEHEERPLWIDACCINQEDDSEKTWQVKLMCKIFNQSSWVIAWLGESTARTAATVDHIRALADMVSDAEFYNSDTAGLTNKYLLEHERDPEGTLRKVNGWSASLNSLARYEWFSRLWVVQEAFLGRAVDFQMGHISLQFSDFLAASVALFAHGGALGRMVVDKKLRPLVYVHQGLNSRISVRDWRDLYSRFGTLLNATTQQQCSDERDRIFSLLGLCPELQEQLTGLGYHQTTAELFREFSLAFLLHGQLSCLHDARHCSPFSSTKDGQTTSTSTSSGTAKGKATQHDHTSPDYLPSWALDLTEFTNLKDVFRGVVQALSAGGSSEQNAVAIDTNTIQLSGIIVATIDKALEPAVIEWIGGQTKRLRDYVAASKVLHSELRERFPKAPGAYNEGVSNLGRYSDRALGILRRQNQQRNQEPISEEGEEGEEEKAEGKDSPSQQQEESIKDNDATHGVSTTVTTATKETETIMPASGSNVSSTITPVSEVDIDFATALVADGDIAGMDTWLKDSPGYRFSPTELHHLYQQYDKTSVSDLDAYANAADSGITNPHVKSVSRYNLNLRFIFQHHTFAIGIMHKANEDSEEVGGWVMAPRLAKKGDVIAVLQGCTYPFVLREVEDSVNETGEGPDKSRRKSEAGKNARRKSIQRERKRYVIVGACWMRGIMKGEMIPKVEEGEKWEDIWLV
jgi:hypothetical protein